MDAFGLTDRIENDLFSGIAPVEPSPVLAHYLDQPAQWALVQRSEIIRREAIIAPFLFEAALRATKPTVVFSEMPLHVNQDLSGYPDYILSRGQFSARIEAPILAVVEAKKDDFVAGEGQCAVEMVAAREFNALKNQPRQPIFGCVTNGSEWFFSRLDDSNLRRNGRPLYLNQAPQILGVLIAIASGTA